jgi:hypothetical protein
MEPNRNRSRRTNSENTHLPSTQAAVLLPEILKPEVRVYDISPLVSLCYFVNICALKPVVCEESMYGLAVGSNDTERMGDWG